MRHLLGISSLVGTASIIFLIVVASFAGLVLIRGTVALVVYRVRSRIPEQHHRSELGLIIGFIAAAAVAVLESVGTNLGTIIAPNAL